MTDTTSLIPVPLGACRCPGKPHGDGDFVYLAPRLSAAAGLAAVAAASSDGLNSGGQQWATALESALELSVRDWTLEHANGDGKASKIIVNPESVREHLSWEKGGAEVVVKALELYGPALGLPFGDRTKKRQPTTSSSPTGQTASPSTSPKPITRSRRRSASA